MTGFDRKGSTHKSRRLSSASTAAAIAVVAAPVNAVIISSGVVDQSVNPLSPFDFDIDSDGNFEFNFSATSGKENFVDIDSSETGATWITTDSFRSNPDRLAANDLIDSSASFALSPFLVNRGIVDDFGGADWNPITTTGYMGLKFDIAGDTHFGWVEITSVSSSSIVLNQWAYESVADTGILAGATGGAANVPEPGSALLLAFGLVAATVLTGRKRRSSNAR